MSQISSTTVNNLSVRHHCTVGDNLDVKGDFSVKNVAIESLSVTGPTSQVPGGGPQLNSTFDITRIGNEVTVSLRRANPPSIATGTTNGIWVWPGVIPSEYCLKAVTGVSIRSAIANASYAKNGIEEYGIMIVDQFGDVFLTADESGSDIIGIAITDPETPTTPMSCSITYNIA